MNKIKIVGIGPGHKDYLLPKAKQAIEGADTIVGGKRHLLLVAHLNKKTIELNRNFKKIVKYINQNFDKESIVVLVSGDTGFYSLGTYLKNNIICSFEYICGINSLQYLFSKLGLSYEETFFGSMHGRSVDLIHKVKTNKKVALLTDQENTPGYICRTLAKYNMQARIYIGENLSYNNEHIYSGVVTDFVDKEFESMNVIIIERIEA